MKLSLILSFFAFYNNFLLGKASDSNFTLELVQVLFRHGDKTPDSIERYKTDPYDPDVYQEYGYGQLTRTGMQRAYKLGQLLRRRYDSFLGDYNVRDVYAYSTDYDRTKTSLQLVLNGLYPPSEKTRWSSRIEWFPIPVHYEPFETDFIPFDIYAKCSDRYVKLLKEAERLPEVAERIEKYGEFTEYLKNETKMPSAKISSAFAIAANIESVSSLGLPLPGWCTPAVHEKLQEIRSLFYDLIGYTASLRRIAIGPTIERLLANVNGDDGRKIYVYGAHDINVALLTRAHNFTRIPATPSFGSAVVLEKLRGPDGRVYLRILYWTGASEKLTVEKLEDCDRECPLSDYADIVSPVLPDPEFRKCKIQARIEM